MSRREYSIFLVVNDIQINKVIIDLHYEQKHGASINDKIILDLVETLNEQKHLYEVQKAPFNYFTTDKIILNGNMYKLIWLLENNKNYIGIINAYRR